jgi:hypothetical protein
MEGDGLVKYVNIFSSQQSTKHEMSPWVSLPSVNTIPTLSTGILTWAVESLSRRVTVCGSWTPEMVQIRMQLSVDSSIVIRDPNFCIPDPELIRHRIQDPQLYLTTKIVPKL